MSRQRWIFLICIVSAQIILSEQVVAQSCGINNNPSDIWISDITENHRSNNNKQQQTYKMQHSLSCVSGDQHHSLISWICLSWIVISNDLLVLVYDCPDWGQGYEVTFVTVPGMDERWCQHLSNIWYTLDRNPDMPVSQCDPSPRGSNVLPHPDRAARHPSLGQFIWTMFTGQWPSLSGIKSALGSCKHDGWSMFSHGTGEMTFLFQSLNSSLVLERLVGSWDAGSGPSERGKLQL